MQNSLQWDWSKGCVFIQDGVIYCSPNSSRPVIIPPKLSHSESPFNDKKYSVFNQQPVWLDDSWGWMSFNLLSPSFTANPFEPLCWMPRIEELQAPKESDSNTPAEILYCMDRRDIFKWKECQRMLVFAVHKMRLWYHIPGALPPLPSIFSFDRPHKSKADLVNAITSYRDWFAIWMGFMSYYVAASGYPKYCASGMSPDPESPIPKWYLRLKKEHMYRDPWLNGLMTSPVCDFDPRISRAGIIYEWHLRSSEERLDIHFFLKHNVPVYFPWTAQAEAIIRQNPSLHYMQPPQQMLKDTLDRIFDTGYEIPLGPLVMLRYLKGGAIPVAAADKLIRLDGFSSYVSNYLRDKSESDGAALFDILDTSDVADVNKKVDDFLLLYKMEAAKAASSLPTQTMIDMGKEEERGRLYASWSTFFEQRRKRHHEMLAVESDINRCDREARQRDPPTDFTSMFTWRTVRSSGGVILFMRVRIAPSNFKAALSITPKSQRIYNAVSNEWDLCRGFKPPADLCAGEDDDDDIDYGSDSGYDYDYTNGRSDADNHYLDPPEPFPMSMSMPMHDTNDHFGNVHDHFGEKISQCYDMIETLRLTYGFLPRIECRDDGNTVNAITGWLGYSAALGFEKSGVATMVSDQHRRNILDFCNSFFIGMGSNSPDNEDLFDLMKSNPFGLHHVELFRDIQRFSDDLFIISGPRSPSSNWILGVNSSQLVLYVCRLLLSHPDHNVLTAASHLLSKGITFRTLLHSDKPSDVEIATIQHKYTPVAIREPHYIFTVEDFETAMAHAQDILNRPHGRAALLKGGIVARIARQYLSVDAVLQGPSIEVTKHCRGFVTSGSGNSQYMDDELTENEMAIICGTYSLYTDYRTQVSIKSWFPPHSIWTNDRNGYRALEWTERNETFFMKRLEDIRMANAQPFSTTEWKERLKGNRITKSLQRNLKQHSDHFVNERVPFVTSAIPSH